MKLTVLGALTLASLSLPSVARADGGAAHQVAQSSPIQMGTSGGSADDATRRYCCAGTLGCLVVYNGQIHILSNNHVLGRSGTAKAGEQTLQPGLIDTGCRPTGTVVGTYVGDLVPLGSNVDAAISLANTSVVDTSGAILDIGVPVSAVQAPTIGLPVMKSGRTTGFTTGSITSVNTSVSIRYQAKCNAGKKFLISYTNQIVTGAMSTGGDSGSLLLSNDGSPNPVGLLYAGSSSTTIYNPAQDVVDAFSAGGNSFSFVGTAARMATQEIEFPTPSQADVAAATQAKVRNESRLFQHPGVIGVGVGAAQDDPTEAVIVVYNKITEPLALPERIDGFRVRVVMTDEFVAQ